MAIKEEGRKDEAGESQGTLNFNPPNNLYFKFISQIWNWILKFQDEAAVKEAGDKKKREMEGKRAYKKWLRLRQKNVYVSKVI